MNRPHDYDEIRVTTRNMAYQSEDEHINGVHAGGVLSMGTIVWIRRTPVFAHAVSVYVEGIGLATIDPRFLIRIEGENHGVGINQKQPDSLATPSA